MKIKIGAIYKHFKGKKVEILLIASHSETLEQMVVYKHLDDDHIWVRPYEMFVSKVDKDAYPNIKQEYRFELVNEVKK